MSVVIAHAHAFFSAFLSSLPVNEWTTEDKLRTAFGLSLLPCFLVALFAPKRQKLVGFVVGAAFTTGAAFIAYTTGVEAATGPFIVVLNDCALEAEKGLFYLSGVLLLACFLRFLVVRGGHYRDFDFSARSPAAAEAFLSKQLKKDLSR